MCAKPIGVATLLSRILACLRLGSLEAELPNGDQQVRTKADAVVTGKTFHPFDSKDESETDLVQEAPTLPHTHPPSPSPTHFVQSPPTLLQHAILPLAAHPRMHLPSTPSPSFRREEQPFTPWQNRFHAAWNPGAA